ncbi:hypothetical protein SEPCBS119000_004919 [Sporothrix epigloea]|uniref:Uncharacterized protein n=1 Tax=Sporothrix epigloea TaxID=1892477 RepID=A0ABP0DYP2_9PEZI
MTRAFMKAYKAMRGPRDAEPNPLIACRGISQGPTGDGSLSKFWMWPHVSDSVETKKYFHAEQPDRHDDGESSITDHLLDHVKLNMGWATANGPSHFDDEDPYVSDDDDDPPEFRISPAMFRALAAGCTPDKADDLRSVFPGTRPSQTVTPQDTTIDVSNSTKKLGNFMPCYHHQLAHVGQQRNRDKLAALSPLPVLSCWSTKSLSPRPGSKVSPSCMSTVIATEHALSQAFRDCWRAIEICQAANEDAQGANTALARYLAILEQQLEMGRKAGFATSVEEPRPPGPVRNA